MQDLNLLQATIHPGTGLLYGLKLDLKDKVEYINILIFFFFFNCIIFAVFLTT